MTSKLAPKDQVRVQCISCFESLHVGLLLVNQDSQSSRPPPPSLLCASQGEGRAYAAMCNSVEALGLGYIDLYLIHWPGASGLKSEDPENARLRHESYRDLQRGFVQGGARGFGQHNDVEKGS